MKLKLGLRNADKSIEERELELREPDLENVEKVTELLGLPAQDIIMAWFIDVANAVNPDGVAPSTQVGEQKKEIEERTALEMQELLKQLLKIKYKTDKFVEALPYMAEGDLTGVTNKNVIPAYARNIVINFMLQLYEDAVKLLALQQSTNGTLSYIQNPTFVKTRTKTKRSQSTF